MHTLILSAILTASGDLTLWLKTNPETPTGPQAAQILTTIKSQCPAAASLPANKIRTWVVRRTLNEKVGPAKPGVSNPLGTQGCWTYGSYEVTASLAAYFRDAKDNKVQRFVSQDGTNAVYWKRAEEKHCTEASRDAWATFVSSFFSGNTWGDQVINDCAKESDEAPVYCKGVYQDSGINPTTGAVLNDAGAIIKVVAVED